MAHLLFDALNGITLDNQTVQSILDAHLQSDVSGSSLGALTPATITLDEEDVFQCGKCKKQFTSFSLFMCHKKEHSAASAVKLPGLSLPLNGTLHSENADTSQASAPADSTSYQELQVQALDSTISNSDLNQPIILSEADILSFSIDESALNITSSTQDTSPLSSVIQHESSFLTSPEDSAIDEKSLVTASNNFNVSSLSGQPIILSSELPESSHMASTLPSIESINTKRKRNSSQIIPHKTISSQNVNVLTAYPEKTVKECKLLLSNVDYFGRDVDTGALLLECDEDKTCDKMQYRNEQMESAGTVLLDYSDGTAGKSCKVLLSNGEFSETSIEYIDNTNNPNICEYSNIPDMENNCHANLSDTPVSNNLVCVVEHNDGSSVMLDLPKEVSDAINNEALTGSADQFILPDVCCDNGTTSVATTFPISVKSNVPSGSFPSSSHTTDSTRPGFNKPVLQCQYCEKMFTKNFDLQQHMRSHTGEKPFQCVVCGRAFSQKSNVKKHMATHKVWPNGLSRTLPKEPLQRLNSIPAPKPNSSDKNKRSVVKPVENDNCTLIIDRSYVCQYCNTSFGSYFELKTHMKDHSHQKVYKCVQLKCQKTFEDLDSFLEHTKMHSDEVSYCCHVCYRKFSTLTDLGIHQHSHVRNNNNNNNSLTRNHRYFLCVKCKSKFTSSKALEHHLSTTNHHFPCTHCGKVFTCERYLRRHLPTHGAPESFVCHTCGKGFRTEQYLNTHCLIHSGLKPFSCVHCSAAFNRKDKLVRHSLIHQAVKKFKCPFHNYLGCSKEFNRQDKLKLHILTHSAVKPHQCRKCNKTFQRQTLLREHERTNHASDAPFTCSRCGMKFRRKVHLSTHACNCNESSETPSGTPQVNPEGNTNNAKTPVRPARNRRLKRVRNNKRTSTPNITKIATAVKDTKVANTGPPTLVKIAPAIKEAKVLNANPNNVGGDNVPTIEIIVLPLSLSERKQGRQDKNVIHLMIPVSSGTSSLHSKLPQTTVNGVINLTATPREAKEIQMNQS